MSTPIVKSDNASGLKSEFTAPVSVNECHAKMTFSKRSTSIQSQFHPSTTFLTGVDFGLKTRTTPLAKDPPQFDS
jgi:hypothetical protein